jgi:hypothetical protein
MLYLIFFVLCVLLSALPSTSRKGSEVVVTRGTSLAFWWGVGADDTLTEHICIHHGAQHVPYYLLELQISQYQYFPL